MFISLKLLLLYYLSYYCYAFLWKNKIKLRKKISIKFCYVKIRLNDLH